MSAGTTKLSRGDDRAFWKNRRVLLTGHTGFKGAWLSLWLKRLGAEVTGVALPPVSTPNLFESAGVAKHMDSRILDIRESAALEMLVGSVNPEVVFHLAAQPLVLASYRDPLETFETNVQGTANLLNALRKCSDTRVVVAVTTDKVYRNVESAYPFRESDALGGHDPYSASKAAAEIVISCFRDAFLQERGIAVASARAGNVVGGGDWSEDRLVPDAVRAWTAGHPLHVRRPAAIRPWQHVLEPLSAYLLLARLLWDGPAPGGSYNFGPHTHEAASVRDVVELACRSFGKGEVLWGDGGEGPHEANWLALETAKARTQLGYTPRWSFAESIERTMSWYRDFADGDAPESLCERDFLAFEQSGSA
ncbi:MAG TPA: CDP-glucose 4,6-dehydratase [Azoarcus taiwanensis]|nr:CDP-glucose 4,6-dehydratase [Azoarcus taiwanensis]